MGGVLDAIFGSEGESSSVEDITPPEFIGLRGPTASQLQRIFSSGGLPAAPGPFAAPLTTTEQSLVSRAGQLAGPSPLFDAASQQLQQTIGGQGMPQSPLYDPASQQLQQTIAGQGFRRSPLYDAASQQLQQVISGQGLSPDSNPFLAATIDAATRPILETFEQDTLPGLRGLFTRAGQQVQNLGSSPFAEALARERTGVANAIGDVATNLAGQNFQAERARQQQAATLGTTLAEQAFQAERARQQEGATLGATLAEQAAQAERARQQQATLAAPAFGQAELERIAQGLETVALPRLVEQYGIDMGIEEFRRRQQSLLEALRIAGGLASPTAAVLPGQAPTTGLLGELVSGFGEGAGRGATGG